MRIPRSIHTSFKFWAGAFALLSDLNLVISSLARIIPTEPAFLSRHASIPAK